MYIYIYIYKHIDPCRSEGDITGYFVPGRVGHGLGLLGIFDVVVSCGRQLLRTQLLSAQLLSADLLSTQLLSTRLLSTQLLSN